MAMLDQTYNTEDLPQGDSFEPVPNGWYQVEIEGAELKDTNSGDGKYINLQLKITGEEYEGRYIWAMLNIQNPSPKAEDIGRRQLGDVLRSIGVGEISDTDQLIGGEMMVKTKIKQSEGYDPQPVVQQYKAIDGGEETITADEEESKDEIAKPAAKKATKKAAAKKATKAKPPWANKYKD